MSEKHILTGAPVEIGSKVFTDLCMPVVQEATKKLNPTKQQLGQLYAGFLGAAVGSMVADFGKAQARDGAQQPRDVVAAGDFDETQPKGH